MGTIGHTLTDNEESGPSLVRTAEGAYLFVLLEAERPQALGSRHSLIGIRQVAIGRGSERSAERAAASDRADLELRVPDQRMSSNHARLTYVRGSWVAEDAGSRNGTRVNGESIEQAPLRDGDILEMGRTLFLFRDELPQSTRLDLDAATLPSIPFTLNPRFEQRLQQLEKIARSSGISILILGESGSGKEVLARRIAEWSGRSGAFVGVNCGALPNNLVESELFGAKRGAFSGAVADRPGLVRSAHGGCLFLDEIAELPTSSQAALLRVLQESEVLPVGGTRPVPVDVQVVSATHQNLEAAIEAGRFRRDLYARIGGFRVAIPPLRERKEDLGLLIGSLLRGNPEASPNLRLSLDAARALSRRSWPLNVRELGHCLSTAVLLAQDDLIEVDDLPEEPAPSALDAPSPPDAAFDSPERDRLIALLEKHNGNVSAIAREVGKARMQVQRWLKRYQLDAASYR